MSVSKSFRYPYSGVFGRSSDRFRLALGRLCALLVVGIAVVVAFPAHGAVGRSAPAPSRPKAVAPKAVAPKAIRPQSPAAQRPASASPKAVRPGKTTKAAKSGSPPRGGASTGAPRSLPAGIDASRRESELYGERLQRLEADVEDLKERVFRSRARLALLKETVLHGVMAGARMIIAHRNLMTSQFRLVKVIYFLDGAQIYARADEDGALDSEDEVVIFDGNLVPGPHNVTIELTYRGRGSGLFSYLNGYVFESRSSHSLTAPEDGALKLLSVGFERGNMTTEMSERPAVSWQEVAIDASGRPAGQRRGKKRGRKRRSSSPAPSQPSGKRKGKKKGKQKARRSGT